MVIKKKTTKPKTADGRKQAWELRLYVAGPSRKTARAVENLKRICEENINWNYKIEVIDILKDPKLAKGEQIFAVPMLVRKLPLSMRKIVGDLSDTERVLVGLDLRPQK